MSLFAKVLLSVTICFFLFVSDAYAVSVTVNNAPSSIGSDPFTLSVAVVGASLGTNYLRVDIYKDGTSNYFGESFTGNDWYGGSDGTRYFPITIGSDKTWNGTVQARIGNTIPQDYDGAGTYKLRVRRYTGGGNYNNDEAKASAIQIVLAFPTPTSLPPNTPTPAPTDKPTKTPKPTATPKPVKSAVVTSATNVQSILAASTVDSDMKKNVLSPTKISSTGAYPTAILHAGTKSAEKKVSKFTKPLLIKGTSSSMQDMIAVSIGGLLLLGCGILLYLKKQGIWPWKNEQ